jgi:integrase
MTIKLTKTSIATLTLPLGKSDAIFFDSEVPGFGLRIRAGGSRKWIVQYQLHGHQQRRLTIGSIALFDPEQARRVAREMLAKARRGQDPQAQKIEASIAAKQTLGSVIERYLAEKRGRLRPRTLREIERYLLGHWKPLHGLPLHKIERRSVAAYLGGAPVAAARARGWLSAVYAWAIAEGLCDANPVIGTRVPDADVRPRDRVLSDAELAAVWNASGDDDYGRIVKLLIITGARRREVGGMSWSELEHEAWTLPAARSKNRRAHTLPLPLLAWTIIDSAVRRDGCLFGRNGFSQWGTAKAALDGRIRIAAWTLHDLRRTVATRMADLGVLPHIVEAVLNHTGHRGGVAGVYNRASYAREMRSALALWTDHLRAIVGDGERKIVALPVRS